MPKYDQFLYGDVNIKKKYYSKHDYKITFSKNHISEVLMYQIWSSTNPALNSSRVIKKVKATKWVKDNFPHPLPSKDAFTPTCVMELRNGECKDKQNRCRHIFVINDAKIKNGKVVFYVSSKDIDIEFDSKNTNSRIKKLKKIPTGLFHHARFDIDANSDANSVCVTQCNATNPPSTFSCTQICNSNSGCLSYIENYLINADCTGTNQEALQNFCTNVISGNSFNSAFLTLLNTCDLFPDPPDP
jgi:hypothetical protein